MANRQLKESWVMQTAESVFGLLIGKALAEKLGAKYNFDNLTKSGLERFLTEVVTAFARKGVAVAMPSDRQLNNFIERVDGALSEFIRNIPSETYDWG